ncbi:MAG: enoyl-CoA hydratase-related protein [Sinimarinibacterium flocculans]|uniref:enoyl-CoA hydratase-related protein n=1 Tax=Sinimarinibacterium flocculans TaxID=985250 RepID=UPI003C63FCB6
MSREAGSTTTDAGFELRIEGAVARISLARAEAMNALTDRFWGALSESIERIDATPSVRALVITAVGSHFCAGMDLDFFAAVREHESAEPGRYREWLRRKIQYLQRPMDQLEALRVPVIACTQGACIGAGLDLVCAADIRLCTADAFFSVHEINVAITADLGVLQRLPQLIAPSVVQDLALTGRRFAAAEALTHGFVSHVADDVPALHAHAGELAARIGGLSPLAVLGTKHALVRQRRRAIGEGLDYMTAWNAAMFPTADIPVAIAAQRKREAASFDDLLP